ncbi:hypothetical protein IV203_000277 [Nitzschia inconspicua]|uniref:Uncharacterized protein n=1 Tax=Nitzschia inconspicua TaxID=303405 RepID=A0A9K3L673_9STRA|nr:hypothetical protein IV203_000277 [Nitzschia inconspicua]
MADDKKEVPLYTETYYPLFFFPYSVTVTKHQISFGYYFWLFSKTVDRSSAVIKAQPLDNVRGFLEWGGWGIRLRRHDGHWETGYIAKNGNAVKITVTSQDQDGDAAATADSYYVFTCSDPQKVCDILNNGGDQ